MQEPIQEIKNYTWIAEKASAPSTGIPLQEYTRDVRPGWRRTASGGLLGKAQKLAMQLRLPRADGKWTSA